MTRRSEVSLCSAIALAASTAESSVSDSSSVDISAQSHCGFAARSCGDGAKSGESERRLAWTGDSIDIALPATVRYREILQAYRAARPGGPVARLGR